MLFCGGECGLEWYLPAFFPGPVTPAQLNPALVFRTQLQWESSRRITPLLVASLTHYSLWIWEVSTAGRTPLLRASSVTRQQLCSEDDAEHKTFLCSNIQPHAQTSVLFSVGHGTAGFVLPGSFSQTSAPGVMKGHAGHLSHGHDGYSFVWQKYHDFQLNSFQV